MIKLLLFILGILGLGFLYLVHNALNRPVYNKISNTWEEDSNDRVLVKFVVILMTILGFVLGMQV